MGWLAATCRLTRSRFALQIIKVLLSSGCNALAVDRSGLTALSLVRTLSRPREEVVQVLAVAESAAFRGAWRNGCVCAHCDQRLMHC
jgi:hypothetical protein